MFVDPLIFVLSVQNENKKKNLPRYKLKKMYAIKIVYIIYSCRYQTAIYRVVRNNLSDRAIAIAGSILFET